MKNPVTLLWLRQDLRLADHNALCDAACRGRVLPVYILDPDDPWPAGGASRWFLHQVLSDLGLRLAKIGAPLLLKKGRPDQVLSALAKEIGATHLAFSRLYEPYARACEQRVREKGKDLVVLDYPSFLLFEPNQIQTKAGGAFKVYTPFAKACFAKASFGSVLSAPKKIAGVVGLEGERLEDFRLLPRKSDWPSCLAKVWDVSEKAAQKRLYDFIEEGLASYALARNRPDQDGVSRLSPYLHFGVLSPRQVWAAVIQAMAHHSVCAGGAEVFLKELLWREFSSHLLFHVPSLPEEPLQASFARFPWRKDSAGLRAWQRGQTGYPIIDAGMRQLWQEGWMHGRVRMLVASFLIKDLLVPWQMGEAWFWDTLVDADLANNAASWQWVSGCGADAAPYFRIFNPVLQGKRFDPNGDYVRRYVPELAGIDGKNVHEPWGISPEALKKAKVTLGKSYPKPILEHAFARQRALLALKESKKT